MTTTATTTHIEKIDQYSDMPHAKSLPWGQTWATGDLEPKYFVTEDGYALLLKRRSEVEESREKAISLLREWMTSHDERVDPWLTEREFTLDEVNTLIETLGGEALSQMKSFHFDVSCTWSISGRIEARTQEEAEEAIEELIGNLYEPTWNTPTSNDWSFDYVDVSWDDNGEIDVY